MRLTEGVRNFNDKKWENSKRASIAMFVDSEIMKMTENDDDDRLTAAPLSLQWKACEGNRCVRVWKARTRALVSLSINSGCGRLLADDEEKENYRRAHTVTNHSLHSGEIGELS